MCILHIAEIQTNTGTASCISDAYYMSAHACISCVAAAIFQVFSMKVQDYALPSLLLRAQCIKSPVSPFKVLGRNEKAEKRHICTYLPSSKHF